VRGRQVDGTPVPPDDGNDGRAETKGKLKPPMMLFAALFVTGAMRMERCWPSMPSMRITRAGLKTRPGPPLSLALPSIPSLPLRSLLYHQSRSFLTLDGYHQILRGAPAAGRLPVGCSRPPSRSSVVLHAVQGAVPWAFFDTTISQRFMIVGGQDKSRRSRWSSCVLGSVYLNRPTLPLRSLLPHSASSGQHRPLVPKSVPHVLGPASR
jgi:hypothetical protein